MTRTIVRVGIIGAGASGLAQLKELLDAFARPEVRATTDLEVVCYEKQGEVGGVWFADETIEKPYRASVVAASSDENTTKKAGDQMYVYPPGGVNPSPMYLGLNTNLPHDLMAFRSHPMPPTFPLFPSRAHIQEYLVSYANRFSLYPHIKLNTTVRRLALSPAGSARRWIIETENAKGEASVVGVDYVCCANGHYADGWIPKVKGMSTFPGKILHSRFFRAAEDYVSQRVLVVGSYASGGDISRLLAAYNVGQYLPANAKPLGPIDVHISSNGPTQHCVNPEDHTVAWGKFITFHPIISSFEGGVVRFEDGSSLDGVDTIIYATGYNFALPFAKISDEPWRSHAILDQTVGEEERVGGDEGEVGGLKGLGVKGLDELMLFLKGDRTLCFPVMQYQVVPFPLAETQTRFTSLLWAGLLPTLPETLSPPVNSTNPYSSASSSSSSSTTSTSPSATSDPSKSSTTSDPISATPPNPVGTGTGVSAPDPSTPIIRIQRNVLKTRQQLVFGSPYEWTYQEYLMDLMREADQVGKGTEVPDHWRSIEGFRKEKRADAGLRKRALGY